MNEVIEARKWYFKHCAPNVYDWLKETGRLKQHYKDCTKQFNERFELYKKEYGEIDGHSLAIEELYHDYLGEWFDYLKTLSSRNEPLTTAF